MAVRTDAVGRLLTQAVLTALEAPSVLNTQPWHWRIDGDAAQLSADRTRQLRVIDPDGRLLTLCCGSSLHHARVALAADGVAVAVSYLPDEADPDLLAVLQYHGSAEPSTAAQRLRAAIGRRRSDRRPFTDEPVPDAVVARLARAAADAGANLHVARPQDRSTLAVAAGHAANVERSDPAYRAEIATWVRGGLPAEVAAQSSGVRPVSLRALDDEPDASIYSGQRVTDRNARYVIVVTDGDSPRDWLTAGEAYSAVVLGAIADGLAFSPMSDLVEVVAARTTLRRMLGDVGWPAMVVRLGVAAASRGAPRSPLRPTADVMDVA
ncbi:Acg family FMN-binding oxidoreductase [Dactylosporangium sucinum]|uniref:NAD(P)H nitroreductase n=1 Tax=Dactylosporangium sucinum TaxID=1424081 RepID=A0A917X1Z3_9ACTN|nr:nitroreductase family protein [Dactylosporangium sucinum]GGM54154.1 NAD(P)H nitroreductase [Dactylosporangium sucinum]